MSNYTITEEQIKSIALGGGKTKIKEMFPEVFETKLEVGKWYKSNDILNHIFYVTKLFDGKYFYYGFNCVGNYEDNDYYLLADFGLKNGFTKATPEEVESALIAEAKKRGYKDKKIILLRGSSEGQISRGTIGDDFDYFPDENKLNIISKVYDYTVFDNGRWAEIIKETPDSFLDTIFNKDLTCKVDKEKYPNSVFYFDGETSILEIEKIEKKLYAWVNYDKIWHPISTKFGLNYSEVEQILKVRIEEHFKLRDVTPFIIFKIIYCLIEEHFKLRDITAPYFV